MEMVPTLEAETPRVQGQSQSPTTPGRSQGMKPPEPDNLYIFIQKGPKFKDLSDRSPPYLLSQSYKLRVF